MKGQWKAKGTRRIGVITPVQIIAPLYRKIRLSYVDACGAVELLMTFAEEVLTNVGLRRSKWEWDVHLVTTSAYKRELRADSRGLSQERVDYLLFKSQPKFFWRCTLTIPEGPLMEVGVDATEFKKSNPVFLVNYFQGSGNAFSVLAESYRGKLSPKLRKTLLTEYKQTKMEDPAPA
jgi:hypothetical protein